MTHTAVEKAIKEDIIRKNTILKKIRRMDRKAAEFKRKAGQINNRRQKKKYLSTATRFIDELTRLKPMALEMVKDLDERVHEEMEFSVEEVASFKEQLSREREEMKNIEAELDEVEEKLHTDEEKYIEGVEVGEGEAETGKLKEQVAADQTKEARLKKKIKKETKRVAGLERELTSEETDRKIFAGELDHIEAEKELLKRGSTSAGEEE
jgi:chromosome segregation ATPase